MALTVGTNSYITMAEAVAYFGGRLRTEPWDFAETADREKALIHATRLLEALPWAGEKSDADQALAFPRGEDDTVPQPIKDAQAELALALLDEDVSHVLTRGDVAHQAQAETVATEFRFLHGAGGKVVVLPKGDEYEAYGGAKNCLARSGGSFHDLPAHVQNLIGDYVALGARLSR
jgi:hypothetical protein